MCRSTSRAGEILGLYGLMGAGPDRAARVVARRPSTTPTATCGWTAASSGRLDVSDRVAAGIAMVPEDRQAAGLVPTMTVRENMTLSSLERAVHARLPLAGTRKRRAAQRCVDDAARQDSVARRADRRRSAAATSRRS